MNIVKIAEYTANYRIATLEEARAIAPHWRNLYSWNSYSADFLLGKPLIEYETRDSGYRDYIHVKSITGFVWNVHEDLLIKIEKEEDEEVNINSSTIDLEFLII